MEERRLLENQRKVLADLRDGYAKKLDKSWLSRTKKHYARIVAAMDRAIFEVDSVLEEMPEEEAGLES